MRAYIDYVGAVAVSRYELDDNELRDIGKFTRENVAAWLDGHTTPDWVGILPVEDFHAVCGETDIPWATEEAKRVFQRVRGVGRSTTRTARHEIPYRTFTIVVNEKLLWR